MLRKSVSGTVPALASLTPIHSTFNAVTAFSDIVVGQVTSSNSSSSGDDFGEYGDLGDVAAGKGSGSSSSSSSDSSSVEDDDGDWADDFIQGE